eukprot:368462_1
MYQLLKHNTITNYIQHKQAQRILDQQAFINNQHREYRLSIEAQTRLEKAISGDQVTESGTSMQPIPSDTNHTNIPPQKEDNPYASMHNAIHEELTQQNHRDVEETKTQSTNITLTVTSAPATPPVSLTPNATTPRKPLPRRPSLVSRSRSLNSIIAYEDEEKDTGRHSILHPQGKYKAMDILGLTPIQPNPNLHTASVPQTPPRTQLRVNVHSQSLSTNNRTKSLNYVTMNEEEALDICDIDGGDTSTGVDTMGKTPTFDSIKALMMSRFSVGQRKKNKDMPFLHRASSSPVVLDETDEKHKAKRLRANIKAMNAVKRTHSTSPEGTKRNTRMRMRKKMVSSPNIIIGEIKMNVTSPVSSVHSNGVKDVKNGIEEEAMSDDDGFVYYEEQEQNEEEDMDIAYGDVEDVELDGGDYIASNDDDDIVEVINNNKLDLPQLEGAVNSM